MEKSIGNGYPISAIIGGKNIMQVAQETFISSTMWTDRLGFIAANATLKKLKSKKINKLISNYGIDKKMDGKELLTNIKSKFLFQARMPFHI